MENNIKPSHYKGADGMSVMNVIKSFVGNLNGIQAFYFGNIVKCVLRFQKKNGVEDLEKAREYLDMLIEEQKKRRDLEILMRPVGFDNIRAEQMDVSKFPFQW